MEWLEISTLILCAPKLCVHSCANSCANAVTSSRIMDSVDLFDIHMYV